VSLTLFGNQGALRPRRVSAHLVSCESQTKWFLRSEDALHLLETPRCARRFLHGFAEVPRTRSPCRRSTWSAFRVFSSFRPTLASRRVQQSGSPGQDDYCLGDAVVPASFSEARQGFERNEPAERSAHHLAHRRFAALLIDHDSPKDEFAWRSRPDAFEEDVIE